MISFKFWIPNFKMYKELFANDSYAFSTFRDKDGDLTVREKMMVELKAVENINLIMTRYGDIFIL